jgi:hypothetical protein
MKILLPVFPLISLFLLFACGPMESIEFVGDGDLFPPGITAIKMESPRKLILEFDEPLSSENNQLKMIPEMPQSSSVEDNKLILTFDIDTIPGEKYTMDGTVTDDSGNSLTFNADFYGYNPKIPEILINEFITQGSGNHPDLVELLVITGGYLGGLCFYEGTPSNYEQRILFPQLKVTAGDYILVHFKPEGIPEEVNESLSKAESEGLDAHDNAWDFWVDGGSGLSGNNGVLSLYTSPGGNIMDAVIYSNRGSDSDERYRGFGSKKTLERVEETYHDGGWVFDGSPRPEEAVNPEDSTATRSICRTPENSDTDTASDWHIVPTRGSTFGEKNNPENYSPD